MKRFLSCILFSLAFVYGTARAEESKRDWKPAVYRGLTIGASSKQDAIRVLGNPRHVGREQDTGIPIMTYQVSEPVKGTLIVYLQKGVIDGITLLPKTRLAKADIVRIFGPDILRVRYSSADCLTQGGSAPIYESKDGEIEHLEYRSQGTAAIVHDDVIQAIAYVSRAFGPTHSPCHIDRPDKRR